MPRQWQRVDYGHEEALPAETILSGIIVASPVKATPDQVFATIEHLTRKPLQLGGKASVGRGLCRVTVVGGISGEDERSGLRWENIRSGGSDS